jgi:hypothetical protein
MRKKEEELWISNISRQKDVCIGDLRITLRIGQSINLLAKGKTGRPRYNITRKQIDDSIRLGSIFQRSDMIKVRVVPPVVFNHRIDVAGVADRNSSRLKRNPTEIVEPDFPDLDMEEGSEVEYAAQNADMDFADRQPILAVDPAFLKGKDQ